MRAWRAAVVVAVMVGAGWSLAACGGSQADELADQLGKAGYTEVSAAADYDTKYNKKKKKNEKTLDDYEAKAKAGSCLVDVEQDDGETDYVIETVNGKDVSFKNMTATVLVAEMAKQGVKC